MGGSEEVGVGKEGGPHCLNGLCLKKQNNNNKTLPEIDAIICKHCSGLCLRGLYTLRSEEPVAAVFCGQEKGCLQP